MPTQRHANGVRDDRCQTLVVHLTAVGVCMCLSQIGSDLTSQLGLDGG
jgi:hypothetical protein